MTLSQLLRLDESDGVTVVPADGRVAGGRPEHGHTYEVLTPALPGQRAEVSLHRLAPGAATGGADDPPIHEPGSRETAVVQSGRVRLACGGVVHVLEEGDAITFDADLAHRFENEDAHPATFLAVVVAGLRSAR
jgi:quercetin dioxygenase-like cupin family protein